MATPRSSPPPPHPPHALGRWGEVEAGRYLLRHGWRILRRNYRFGRREVDLVAARDGLVAFVEVKTRSGGQWGGALHAIGPAKRREIEAVAAHYLLKHPLDHVDIRFDAVAVSRDADGRARIEHVEDAWRP